MDDIHHVRRSMLRSIEKSRQTTPGALLMTSHDKILDRYRFIAILAKNERVETQLAQDMHTDTLMVIKKARDHNSDWLFEFKSRAQFWSGLKHPNLVEVYSAPQSQKTAYCVMEYLAGESLHELGKLMRRQHHPLPSSAIAQIFLMLADGLSHFHQALDAVFEPTTRVHGGIDLHNTFLCDAGIVKLMDHTSVSRRTALSDRKTDQPDTSPSDQRSDIYALGLTILELIANHPAGAILKNPIPSHTPGIEDPMKIRDTPLPDLPAKLHSILMTCLAEKPEQRFQNAAALLQALSSYIKEIEDQDPRMLLAKLAQQWLQRRKKLKTALIHAAIHKPHFQDFLFENLGDDSRFDHSNLQNRTASTTLSAIQKTKRTLKSSNQKVFAFGLAVLGALLSLYFAFTILRSNESLEPVAIPSSRDSEAQPAQTPHSSRAPRKEPGQTSKTEHLHPPHENTQPAGQAESTTADEPHDSGDTGQTAKGYLRLKTEPQTSVYLKDKFMGNTPIEDMALEPGWYRFELINKEAGISRVFRVRIRKGQVSSHTIIY